VPGVATQASSQNRRGKQARPELASFKRCSMPAARRDGERPTRRIVSSRIDPAVPMRQGFAWDRSWRMLVRVPNSGLICAASSLPHPIATTLALTRRRLDSNRTFRKSAASEPFAALPEDQPSFTTMPRPPCRPFVRDGQNRAHAGARRGGHALSGYQLRWRSGRDSNSRTGYARYGISSAAPSTRLGDRSAASRFYPPLR
jgi:hypothetical protein